MRIEDKIKRKGLELGFTHVGIAPVRDYPEYLEEALSRPNHETFTKDEEAIFRRVAMAATRNPKAKAVVCATIGYSHTAYPLNLAHSIGRCYLARCYNPPADQRYGAIMNAFADYLEELGLRPDRNQFNVPQRLVCAEAGITTYGHNNFAYTPEDGSLNILVTYLVEEPLEFDEPTMQSLCPPDCNECVRACPTKALYAPGKLDLGRCILFNNQRFAPGAQQEIWDDMDMRIHGCDACQAACPRNKHILNCVDALREDPFLEELEQDFDLERVLTLSDEYYEEEIKPIMYNYIKDMDIFRRNAAVALGNSQDPSHIPALQQTLDSTENEHVKAACAWAIGKLSE